MMANIANRPLLISATKLLAFFSGSFVQRVKNQLEQGTIGGEIPQNYYCKMGNFMISASGG